MNSLRYAFRQLVRRPALSAVIVLMVALGVGATTAMFSMFHTILFERLPVPAAERLVNLGAPGPKWGFSNCNIAGPCDLVFSYSMFRDLEARQDALEGIAGHLIFEANLATDAETTSGTGMLVSGGYFDVLNLRPTLGRLIGPQDDARVREGEVAVLSHAYWQGQFGAAPDVVGRTVLVNGETLTIIGVAPEGFSGTTIGLQPRVFVPLTMRWRVVRSAPPDDENRRSYWIYAFGRLRDGGSLEQAATGLNVLYSGILNEIEAPQNADMPPPTLEQFRARRITLEPGGNGQSNVRVQGRLPAILLFSVTVVVLLIACVNIAGLLLARGAARRGEVAIRASLGARRSRLVGQFLTETGLLALLGGIVSLPIAELTLRAVVAMIPATIVENTIQFSIDEVAMVFAAGASLATLLLFGLVPALHATSSHLGAVAKGHASGTVGGRSVQGFRRVLATAQIAFSLVLLVLAGLLVQSLVNVARVDLGLRVESLVTFTVSPGRNGYEGDRVLGLFGRLEQELKAEPGVTNVATASVRILSGNNWGRDLSVEGFESGPGIDSTARVNYLSPGFFATLSIPLLAGRDFTLADRDGAPRVAIVNEAFVRKFGLGDGAVGKRIALEPGRSELDTEIVGVVADAKYSEVKDAVPPQFFLPRLQLPLLGTLSFYVRAAVPPGGLMERIRPIVTGIDPTLPVQELMPMEQVANDNVFLERLLSLVAASFAVLATLLAAVGLYGVLAYGITERTRELGLRLALGATPGDLRRLVLAQVARMALIGVPLGLIFAVLAGRGTETLLYGVSGYDPAVLVAAVTLIGAVVLLAGLLPALTAARITPMEALRYE